MSTQVFEVKAKVRAASVEDKLADVVRRANEDHPGDVNAAASAVERAIRRSATYREAAITIAARYLVRQDCFSLRHEFRIEPSADTATNVTRAPATNDHQRAMIQAVSDRWYDWPLPFSMGRAGDATRETCEQISACYSSHIGGMRHNQKVIDELGKRIPEGKRARDVISSAELGKILKGLK